MDKKTVSWRIDYSDGLVTFHKIFNEKEKAKRFFQAYSGKKYSHFIEVKLIEIETRETELICAYKK